MAAGSIYRIAIIGSGGLGQELVNTLYYRAVNDTIFDTQSEDLAQAWAASQTTLFAGTFASSNQLQRLEVRGVTDITEGFDYSYPSPVAGTRTGSDPLPPQSAGIITWTTGLVGRRYRGRSFLWYTVEGDQSQGTWDAGYLGAMAAYADNSLTIGDGITTSFYAQVVHSAPKPAATPPWAGADTDVNSYIVRNLVYQQRRRRVGVGS